jgi:hypothetical protein
MITDSAWVHPELTPALKELLSEAARQLTAHKRRAFLAQVTDQFFGGSARQAESRLGWSRRTIALGQKERQSGILCLEAFHARGNRKIEEKEPRLEADVRALADAQAQADPQWRSTLVYTRLSAAGLRRALIKEKGWRPEQAPAERTLSDLLNRLGYRLRAAAKTKPEKKRASAMPSSPTCGRPTRRPMPMPKACA